MGQNLIVSPVREFSTHHQEMKYNTIKIGSLDVEQSLYALVNEEIAPETGVDPSVFCKRWKRW